MVLYYTPMTGEYKYSKEWFLYSEIKHQIMAFMDASAEHHILEIGCFEGLSSVFFADNLLHHPLSRMTCVDPFLGMDDNDHAGLLEDGVEERFDHNISVCGNWEKITVHKTTSDAFFASRDDPVMFNLIYIDGSHMCDQITKDMENCFRVLSPGGIMWMDDYRGGCGGQIKQTMDAFLDTYQGQYDTIHVGYQLAVKKH